MSEKRTEELMQELGRTHSSDFKQYMKNNEESMLSRQTEFSTYIKDLLYRRHLTQQEVFRKADIPERYGYKLLSGEKYTKKRDVILRICFAGGLDLKQTQRALEKYGMPQLYPKVPRDALLIIYFTHRPDSLTDLNEGLQAEGFEPLACCGAQE
ncbi:MAG: hypothetical protein ACOX78_08215 [Lachnospiraceae bacterium]|jgi:hypothetical protein